MVDFLLSSFEFVMKAGREHSKNQREGIKREEKDEKNLRGRNRKKQRRSRIFILL